MLDKTIDYSPANSPEAPRAPQAGEPGSAGYAELSETLAAMPAESEEDEAALELYMNSMLERLTGNKAPDAAEGTVAEPEEAVEVPEPVVEVAPAREPARPSESIEDLCGMRELANQTAENALGVHSSRQLVRQTRSALATAMGASVTSSVMVVYTQSQPATPAWAMPAALAALGAAVVMSLRYFKLAARIGKLERKLDAPAAS